MAAWFEELAPDHVEFIREQKVFFVATAPSSDAGFPNLSPKGYDSLEILSPREIVFADLPGSGNQTASQLSRGSNLTLMFCSFGSQALILRVYGHGRVHARDSESFAVLAPRLRDGMISADTRQLISIEVAKVQTSCGYAVPRYEFVSERNTLRAYFDRARTAGQMEEKLKRYTALQEDV